MSAATTQLTRRVLSATERLTCSNMGNPRFRFRFDDGSSAVLQSNSGFGYEVGNPGFRDGDAVDVAFSRAGTVRYMRAVPQAGDMLAADGLGA